MVKTQTYLGILFGLLLMADVVSSCVPDECLRCNATLGDSCSYCKNATQCVNGKPEIPSNCTRDFEVTINPPGSSIKEGDDITLTCVHNLPNVILIKWTKDGEDEDSNNSSQLVLTNVLSSGEGNYACIVNSTCGQFNSSSHEVTVESNAVIILVICGVSALALVVIMGAAMKYKLRRDNAKHKERMKQRAQAGQSGAPGPPPFTPRES